MSSKRKSFQNLVTSILDDEPIHDVGFGEGMGLSPQKSRSDAVEELSELAPNEAEQLIELETIIDRGMQTFVEVGRALEIIRKKKLYRQTFKTFEEYLKERMQLDRRRAYELMNASMVINELNEQLPDDLSVKLIVRESQAKAIGAVPVNQRTLVLESLQEKANQGEAITARLIKETADRLSTVETVTKATTTKKIVRKPILPPSSPIELKDVEVIDSGQTEQIRSQLKQLRPFPLPGQLSLLVRGDYLQTAGITEAWSQLFDIDPASISQTYEQRISLSDAYELGLLP